MGSCAKPTTPIEKETETYQAAQKSCLMLLRSLMQSGRSCVPQREGNLAPNTRIASVQEIWAPIDDFSDPLSLLQTKSSMTSSTENQCGKEKEAGACRNDSHAKSVLFSRNRTTHPKAGPLLNIPGEIACSFSCSEFPGILIFARTTSNLSLS